LGLSGRRPYSVVSYRIRNPRRAHASADTPRDHSMVPASRTATLRKITSFKAWVSCRKVESKLPPREGPPIQKKGGVPAQGRGELESWWTSGGTPRNRPPTAIAVANDSGRASRLSDLKLIYRAGGSVVHVGPVVRPLDGLCGQKTGPICPRSPSARDDRSNPTAC